MDYLKIRDLPTVIDEEFLSLGAKGIHESVLRSYHILEKVKFLLQEGCSSAVILEIIELMEGK